MFIRKVGVTIRVRTNAITVDGYFKLKSVQRSSHCLCYDEDIPQN